MQMNKSVFKLRCKLVLYVKTQRNYSKIGNTLRNAKKICHKVKRSGTIRTKSALLERGQQEAETPPNNVRLEESKQTAF